LCTIRAPWNAAGPAINPINPPRAAFPRDTAVPNATPTQTKRDQEVFCTRSAKTGRGPFNVPKDRAKISATISRAMPSRIASHAARNRRAPGPLPAVGIVATDASMQFLGRN
jgi:hypothetical protein